MIEAVLGQIVDAELEPATERCAVRLLLLARDGQVNLTWEGFLELVGMRNVSAARRHLTRMAKAGLIHYSTNDYVYITFLAYMRAADGAPARCPEREDGASTRRPRREDGAPTRRPRREVETDAPPTARPRAAHGASTRQNVYPVRPVRLDLYQEGSGTNQPEPEPDGRVGLLREVGVDPDGLDLRGVSMADLLAIVLDWEADRERGAVGIGALVWRVKQRAEKGAAWKIPEIEDWDHPLVERYAPGLASEMRRRRYVPDEYADIILS